MKIQSDKIEMVSAAALIPHPKNMNKHSDAQIERLCELIKYQGFRNPIVVQKGTNLIVAGHGRLMAAGKLGIKQVPVTYQEFESEAQLYAYMVSDNAIASWAELDLAMINDEALKLGDDFNIDMLGIEDFQLIETEELEPQCDEDAVPENVDTRAKPGDVWQLGKHRLMCGDSTNIQHVEKLMNGEKAALVVTDPPYNVAVNDESAASLKARNRRTDGLKIENDKMSEEQFFDFLRVVFSNYHAVMTEGGSIYVFYADSMTIPFMTTFMEAGFHFAQNCIWNKQQFVMTRKDYHYKHEPVLYGWKKGAAHSWLGDRKQSSVWNFDRPFRSELHPTMKPVNLVEYPLTNSSAVGSIVLDLFGGSGSTLIACEKTNRKGYMMELDPHYASVIITRWEAYTGKTAKRLEEGTDGEKDAS